MLLERDLHLPDCLSTGNHLGKVLGPFAEVSCGHSISDIGAYDVTVQVAGDLTTYSREFVREKGLPFA
jgi:hypothetical protein